MLHPEDKRRLECFQKSVETFRLGLKWLGVKHEFIDVPYGRNKLKATYYPGPAGAEGKPLLIIGGGLDSTQEELYFFGAAALERGYSVLTYSGPGQGAALREQGLKFTHEWEKPVDAVLNAYSAQYSKPRKIVLIGVSLGGYLASRAAAFEDRVDGVVVFDVLFDLREAIDYIIGRVPSNHPFYPWSIAYNTWAYGAQGEEQLLNSITSCNLKEVAQHITCDVLILAGENDFFIPIKQAGDFKRSLINARSITSHIYTSETGGDEHCQIGYKELVYGDLFDWIADKFSP
jgi:pimeloyl-ACP methyl ester carboxylesterase